MGTAYRVTLTQLEAAQRVGLPELHVAIETELAEVNRQMSSYDPASELSQFNAMQSGECLVVSDALHAVVVEALSIQQASGGSFNPLLAPLVNRWGFGHEAARQALPGAAEVSALLALSSTANISLGENPPRLCKHASAAALDLSAIAKGHGVDRIAILLERHGLRSYLVDIGGEIRVNGLNPSLQLWQLAVEVPQAGSQPGEAGAAAVLRLTGKAVATSGDYRNFFEHDGQLYSHTIDPLTGFPVRHDLVSASVIADSAMQADAWATALLAAGPQRAMQLARENALAVLLQRRVATVTPAERLKGWRALDAKAAGPRIVRWHSAAMEKYLLPGAGSLR